MSIIVNTTWKTEPEIFIGTITHLAEIPNGEHLPVPLCQGSWNLT